MDKQKYTLPRDYYWADEDDPKKLCGYLRDKIGAYQDRMRRSSILARILRNWRYVHGLYYSAQGGRDAIAALGDEGHLAGLSINEMRSQKERILSIVTGNRPAFDAKAVNSDMESLSQTKLANQTLDYYLEKENLELYLVNAYDHALVLLQGFVYTVWDTSKGKLVRPDMTGGMIREGDLFISNPTIFDIAYDTTARNWDEIRWVAVRTKRLRWDLANRYPEAAESILSYGEDEWSELEWCPINISDGDWGDEKNQDLVSEWTFHHLDCDALPGGRTFKFVGETELPGQDMVDIYGFIPLSRVVAGEFQMTPHGYSPLLDLQGINEAINGEASTILTTHRNHGRPIITMPTGTNLSPVQLEGYTMVETDGQVAAVNLGQVPGDMFQYKRDLRQDGEYVTGVNSVARGQPQSKEASGSALALIEAQAAQANSPGIRNFNHLVGDVGTKMLKILDAFLPNDEERLISVTGKHNRNYAVALKQGSFSRIDRVQVVPGNALTRSLSGRLQLLDYISRFQSVDGTPMLKTPDEIINLVLNGSFEPMTEAEVAELTVIRDENGQMLDGKPVTALIMDNHVLHIREHKAQLNTTQARMDPNMASIVGAHIMEHVQQLLEGGIAGAYLQQALGYAPPPSPMLMMGMGGMPGMPGEAPQIGVAPQGATAPGANPPKIPGPNPDSSAPGLPAPPRAQGGQPASERP